MIFRECNLANIDNCNATFSNLNFWNTSNFYSDCSGLDLGGDGFTYDTGINSNNPITSSGSCMPVAAKTNTI